MHQQPLERSRFQAWWLLAGDSGCLADDTNRPRSRSRSLKTFVGNRRVSRIHRSRGQDDDDCQYSPLSKYPEFIIEAA